MCALVLTALIGWMLLSGNARAESAYGPRPPSGKAEAQKPKTPRPLANPCAQFGPGFARIEGSDTCVQIGGSIGISGSVR